MADILKANTFSGFCFRSAAITALLFATGVGILVLAEPWLSLGLSKFFSGYFLFLLFSDLLGAVVCTIWVLTPGAKQLKGVVVFFGVSILLVGWFSLVNALVDHRPSPVRLYVLIFIFIAMGATILYKQYRVSKAGYLAEG